MLGAPDPFRSNDPSHSGGAKAPWQMGNASVSPDSSTTSTLPSVFGGGFGTGSESRAPEIGVMWITILATQEAMLQRSSEPKATVGSRKVAVSGVCPIFPFDSSICHCMESLPVLGSQKRHLHKVNRYRDCATQKRRTLRASSEI